MARSNRLDAEQRAELHHILDWTRQPVKTPVEAMTKLAVKCFLDGVDPEPVLAAKGIEPFIYRIALNKARIFLGNERAKRRRHGAAITAARTRNSPTFTFENFGVTIDNTQDRNYGMAFASIYCIVEVWEQDENDEVEKEYLVNFSDSLTKEWLTKLLVWGLMNKKEILIKPAGQHEMSSMRMFVPKSGAAVHG